MVFGVYLCVCTRSAIFICHVLSFWWKVGSGREMFVAFQWLMFGFSTQTSLHLMSQDSSLYCGQSQLIHPKSPKLPWCWSWRQVIFTKIIKKTNLMFHIRQNSLNVKIKTFSNCYSFLLRLTSCLESLMWTAKVNTLIISSQYYLTKSQQMIILNYGPATIRLSKWWW